MGLGIPAKKTFRTVVPLEMFKVFKNIVSFCKNIELNDFCETFAKICRNFEKYNDFSFVKFVKYCFAATLLY